MGEPIGLRFPSCQSGVTTKCRRHGVIARTDGHAACGAPGPERPPGQRCPGRTLLFSRSVLEIMFCSVLLFFSSSLSFFISFSMSWICWKSFNNRGVSFPERGAASWAERSDRLMHVIYLLRRKPGLVVARCLPLGDKSLRVQQRRVCLFFSLLILGKEKRLVLFENRHGPWIKQDKISIDSLESLCWGCIFEIDLRKGYLEKQNSDIFLFFPFGTENTNVPSCLRHGASGDGNCLPAEEQEDSPARETNVFIVIAIFSSYLLLQSPAYSKKMPFCFVL